MKPAPWSWQELLPAAGRAWNHFFHASADVRIVTLLRVMYATLMLVNVACWWPYLDQWFGSRGILPWQTFSEIRNPAESTLFAWLPETDFVLYGCYSLLCVHLFLLLVGFLPRLQAICVFVWLVSFTHRQPLIWDSEDIVFRLLGFLLIFLPFGKTSQSASLQSSGWALRLLQTQMCLIFADAAFAKLQGDVWWDGTAVYYASRIDEFAAVGAVPDFVFDTPWIVCLLSWGTIAIEALVPIGVWFRETRRPALLAALCFHLGCAWTMHLFLFHWIMLCGWCAFLASEDLDFLATTWRRLVRRNALPPSTIPQSET